MAVGSRWSLDTVRIVYAAGAWRSVATPAAGASQVAVLEPAGKALSFCSVSLVLSTNKLQHWASWQGQVFEGVRSTFTKQAKRVNSELNGKKKPKIKKQQQNTKNCHNY